jgi:hypothetical protein
MNTRITVLLVILAVFLAGCASKFDVNHIVTLKSGITLWSVAAGRPGIDSDVTCQPGNQRFEIIDILAVGDTFWYKLSPLDDNPYCHSGWIVEKDIPDQSQ